MPPPAVRRVVTGHNAEGLSIVALDEVTQGTDNTQVWMTVSPLSNHVDDWEPGRGQPGRTVPQGSALRLADIPPGYRSAMHRTQTIDYVFILGGELSMELDGGEWVDLRAGDIVVQRGTMHAWENRSNAICRMAAILIASEPVRIGERVLEATMT